MTDRTLLRLFYSLLALFGVLLAITGVLMLFDPARATGLQSLASGGGVEFTFTGSEADPAFTPGPLLLASLSSSGQPASQPTSSGESLQPTNILTSQLPPEIPTRITIDSIQLDAPITPALPGTLTLDRQEFRIWDVPAGFTAGWHTDSARLGETGNVVLNGHHNTLGQVFAGLVELEPGAEIIVYGEHQAFTYYVTESMLLPETDQPVEVRLANSQWILPTSTPRLTLVTCWPYETNTHRLIVLAEP